MRCVGSIVPGGASGLVAGYTPLVDPLDAQDVWWVLLVPLAVLISVAYKAIRLSTLEHFVREVLVMTTQVLLGMVALGAAVYVLIAVIVPTIAPMPGR